MLQGYPTKNGTGISIFGDYGDLTNLYSTVHEINKAVDGNDKSNAQSQLLMNFAYEIRKAYSGQRLFEKLSFIGDDRKFDYFGFNCVWTDILIFISTLRHNAGYVNTEKLHQANMYMLQHIIEKALFAYDPQGASSIIGYMGQGINITNQFAFIIYQALHIDFVSDKPGKIRFRKIPQLINNYFSESGQEYKDLIHSFEISAKQQNCKITDLGFNDFPEIKW